jgi:hypothetical protein
MGVGFESKSEHELLLDNFELFQEKHWRDNSKEDVSDKRYFLKAHYFGRIL